MGFDKVIPSKIAEYKLYDVDSKEELVKVASDVDFPEGFVYDPDFFYMWVRIVSAGEYYGPNKNGDYFPEEELKSYWETFRDAHPFKNHENKNVENAIGKIITARWNPVMKCVEILKGIDKKRAPEIVRGYMKGYLTDVSMGCKVPYTVCSICGNKARKRSEFCEHVKRHRLQVLGNGERVYEINYKPKFHDSSTVLNGAERVAKAFFIVDTPENHIQSSFRKAASSGGVTHYIPATDYELDKIAKAHEAIHPLLKEEKMDKQAAVSPMMKKIAEFEKELTGKLLNIVSTPNARKTPEAKQMLEVIKFLTEKRMDEASLESIASSVKDIAKANGVPVSRAFTTLIGVAELMGIEFFPNELHTILTNLTDARLNDSLSGGDYGTEPVYPGEFADGINASVRSIEDVPEFDDPSSLLKLYDDAAYRTGDFLDNPAAFVGGIRDTDEVNQEPSVRMIKVIRNTLEPVMSVRSHHPEHLYPRLSLVLSGHRPVIGAEDVRRDFDLLSHPATAGDILAKHAYGLYENIRPKLAGTRLIKVASETGGMEKAAAGQENIGLHPDRKKGGLGYGKLMMISVPAAFGASAYQKSRRENHRYLDDKENFVADHPGLVAGGAILGGKPLSRAVSNAAKKGKPIADEAINKIKAPFTKLSSDSGFEGMVKVADSLPSGDFNVFSDHEVLKGYMDATGATAEQAGAVKLAALFTVGGMEKEAAEILRHYELPNQEPERLMKVAADYMDKEMDKAAEDFTNNLILSTIGDTSPLARTLPGRAVDALIFKKLGDLGQQQPQVPEPAAPKQTIQ